MQRARMMRLGTGLMAVVVAVLMTGPWEPVAAGGTDGEYRVLKPIQSEDLTLFPVVRADGKALPADHFLTLDEGLKSGEVEVTEAGKVQGLARGSNALALHRRSGEYASAGEQLKASTRVARWGDRNGRQAGSGDCKGQDCAARCGPD